MDDRDKARSRLMLDPVYFGDAAIGAAFWASHEWKKWRVDVLAGPDKKPTYARTYYARAKDRDGAIRAVRINLIGALPRGARFTARVAGPRELGCV